MEWDKNTKIIVAVIVAVVVIAAAVGIGFALNNNNNGGGEKTTDTTLRVQKLVWGTDEPTLYIKDADGKEVKLELNTTVKLPTNGTASIYCKDSGWTWNATKGGYVSSDGLHFYKIEIENSKTLTHDNDKFNYTFTYDKGQKLVFFGYNR